jgi:hypothetical protein
MPKAKPSSATFVVLTNRSQLATLQTTAAEQLLLIDLTENENVKRRIAVGLALLCIKESLKHGEWMPWLKNNVKGARQRQCNYMLSAAKTFLAEVTIPKAKLAALATRDLALTIKGGSKGKLSRALDKFVGEQTWGELLDAHGIKETGKLGGARNVTPAAPDAPADAEQLYLCARDEIGAMIEHAETLLVKESRLAHLVGHPDEVRGVVDSLRALADKVEAAAQPLLTAKPTA